MRALLLTGEYASHNGKIPGLEKHNGETLLDYCIHKLVRELQLEVGIVMGGNSADDVIRQCRRMDECDFIYDTTPTSDASLMTNFMAGIPAASREFFVLPVMKDFPDKSVWQRLRNDAVVHPEASSTHLFYPESCPVAQGHLCYPILVTRRGMEEIPKLKEINDLTDAQIKATPTTFQEELRSVAL